MWVLSNGDRAHFGQLDGAQLEARMRGESLEGDIYRKLFGIGEAHRNEILARYPKIQRRVSGYNLDEFRWRQRLQYGALCGRVRGHAGHHH